MTTKWPDWVEVAYVRIKKEFLAPSVCIWGLLDSEDLDDWIWIGDKWL